MKYLAPFVLLMLAGCSTQPTVKSWLDPVSLATITAQTSPLVLARVEKRRTADGLDYAQLAAIEINRMGDRRLYLLAVLKSNGQLSGRQWQYFESSFAQIEVRLDDHAITLTRLSDDVSALGIGQSPLPLPISGLRHIYFPIERAALRAMAQSKSVQLTALGGPAPPQSFEEREDGRQSLGDFLSQLPGEASNLQSNGSTP
jgi:hypothetical protein